VSSGSGTALARYPARSPNRNQNPMSRRLLIQKAKSEQTREGSLPSGPVLLVSSRSPLMHTVLCDAVIGRKRTRFREAGAGFLPHLVSALPASCSECRWEALRPDLSVGLLLSDAVN
jgi:hypothetical protein